MATFENDCRHFTNRFTQGQFAFKTKRNSGSYKTHQAMTEKIVSFSETLRKGMSLAFKFTEKGPEICL